MKYYFVSYSYQSGFGYAFVSCNGFLDFPEFKKVILEQHNTEDAIIINYKEVSKDEYKFHTEK